MAAGPHIVRYGFAGDQYLLTQPFAGTYDQVVLNAKTIAVSGGALAGFFMDHLLGKPYFIDPQTHAFQHGRQHLLSKASEERLAPSFAELIRAYGEPLLGLQEGSAGTITPTDFGDTGVIEGFAGRVRAFQLHALPSVSEDHEAAKYIKYIKKKLDKVVQELTPALIVAAYFFLDSTGWQEWLAVNKRVFTATQEMERAGDPPLAVQVVLSKDLLLHEESRNVIAEEYASLNPHAILLWVDSLDEREATSEELLALSDLAAELSRTAPVINLYGGFFSVLLLRQGRLSGVAHGLGYGEDRGVVPIGGGVASAKYYLPALHTRLLHREAYRVARELGGMETVESFRERICDCPECQRVIDHAPSEAFSAYGRQAKSKKDGKLYPTSATRAHCVKHYMWCKQKEFAGGENLEEALETMDSAAAELAEKVEVRLITHTSRWARVLRKT